MLEMFLLVGLPYLAITVCIVGTVYRFRSDRYHVSSLSSQFLEGRKLLWGSAPWHLGLVILFTGHLAAFIMPDFWHDLMTIPALLFTVEVIGIAAALLCLLGLLVLLYRRITTDKLQHVTKTADIVVLVVLLVQIALGLATAVGYRWGAIWSTGTLSPYIWSIITFRPDVSLVRDLPLPIQLHLTGAWIVLLVIPFSRLIHMFSVPLQYLIRSPQIVIWNNSRRTRHATSAAVQQESRRHFVKGAVGLAAAGTLLSVGVLDKMFRFFQMPGLHKDEEAKLLESRLKRLHLTAEEKQLELERLRQDAIFVAKLEDLSPNQGKYFIDYAMRPAIALAGDDGWPMLISAKCTHLGCTVGNQVDSNGKILCPCHVSYFDVKTGMPNPGAPAKAPLGRIGYIIQDESGAEIASESPRGTRTGRLDLDFASSYSVYIVKSLTPEA